VSPHDLHGPTFPLDYSGRVGHSVGMTAEDLAQPKRVDSKGRVTLGKHFANRTVLVLRTSENEVVVKLARVIPEDEAWLHENQEARTAVRRGIAEASAGNLAEAPDLDADSELAGALEDD